MDVDLRPGTAADVDSLMPLWISMVEHHRDVAGHEWPVKEGGAAWLVRMEEYRGWLADGSGTLFIAGAPTALPLGYAMLRVHEPGATWDLGPEVGEVESLAVARSARGTGIGSRLLAECRAELRRRGIRYWSVAVVEANAAAVRLYEREGFRAYYRDLLGEVGA